MQGQVKWSFAPLQLPLSVLKYLCRLCAAPDVKRFNRIECTRLTCPCYARAMIILLRRELRAQLAEWLKAGITETTFCKVVGSNPASDIFCPPFVLGSRARADENGSQSPKEVHSQASGCVIRLYTMWGTCPAPPFSCGWGCPPTGGPIGGTL